MSPKSEAQLHDIRKKSRSKILRASLELFASKGYHNTSVGEIAKLAEVAKGLVYNYFESKEALLEALIAQGFEEMATLYKDLEQEVTAEQKFRHMIHYAFDYMTKHFEHFKLLMALSLQLSQFPRLLEKIQAKNTHNIPYLASLLEEMDISNPKQEAMLIGSLLEGVGLQYIVLHKNYPIEEMRRYIIEKYCHPS